MHLLLESLGLGNSDVTLFEVSGGSFKVLKALSRAGEGYETHVCCAIINKILTDKSIHNYLWLFKMLDKRLLLWLLLKHRDTLMSSCSFR